MSLDLNDLRNSQVNDGHRLEMGGSVLFPPALDALAVHQLDNGLDAVLGNGVASVQIKAKRRTLDELQRRT